MNCIFCKIINQEINSKTIYQDALISVILDINPDSTGHMLIIPKEHIVCIDDLTPELNDHIFNISKLLYKHLIDKLNIDGVTFVQNNGAIQEVKHYHMHVKPYYKLDPKLSLDEVYNKLKERYHDYNTFKVHTK